MPFFLRTKKSLLVLVSLILFQLFLISFQLPLGEETNYLEKVIFNVFTPLQHGLTSFFQKIGQAWKDYFYLVGVRGENKRMQEKVDVLLHENNLLKILIQKLSDEKELQEMLGTLYQDVLPVRVIGYDFSNRFKSAVINKGSLDGIKRNMFVLDKFGNLVGRVTSPITLKEARVQLITDRDSGASVQTEKSRLTGVLSGDGKGMCNLKYIPGTAEGIGLGELVLTSGFDEIFPQGIVAGRIVSLKSSTSLFKDIVVKPSFEFKNLGQIAVVKLSPRDFF